MYGPIQTRKKRSVFLQICRFEPNEGLRSSFFVRVGEWVSQSVLVWRVGDLRLETRGGVREPYVRTASSSHDYHDSPEFHSNVVRGARGLGVSSCGVAWALGCYYYYYEYECWFDCVDGDGGAG